MAYDDFDDEDVLDESLGIGELERPPVEFPDDLGTCIDKYYQLRAQRLNLEKEVKERKRTEKAYMEHIVAQLRSINMENGGGRVANASIKEVEVPTPKDWPAIWEFVEENNAWDLLQKRLSGKAVQERWDQEIVIPGIDTFTKVSLSLTKKGG